MYLSLFDCKMQLDITFGYQFIGLLEGHLFGNYIKGYFLFFLIPDKSQQALLSM